MHLKSKDYSDEVNPNNLLFVKRKDWGAPLNKWGKGAPLLTPALHVFCLCTNKRSCDNLQDCTKEMLYLFNRHMKTALCPDIKYSFVIGGDGRVYVGRGWTARPGLPEEHRELNKNSVFIALAGYYRENHVPRIMLKTRDQLIQYGIDNKYISEDYDLYSSIDS